MMIHGINPSIARLVHYMNFFGYITSDSHASFYPGDPEEQEYWIQKEVMDRDYNKVFSGPIVMVGNIFRVPSIEFGSSEDDLERLTKILPEYWELSKVADVTESLSHYMLDYNNPQLIAFGDVFNEIYYELIEQYDLELEEIMQIIDIDEINNKIISELPMGQKLFNEIRNEGIKSLETNIFQEIPNLSDKTIKRIVDALTGAERYYKK